MTSLTLRLIKIKTLYKLGVFNLFRVVVYRCKCRLGLYAKLHPIKTWSFNLEQPFFYIQENFIASIGSDDLLVHPVDEYMRGKWQYYFYHWFDHRQKLPRWNWNPFMNREWQENNSHWSRLSYFRKPGDDIKHIWELSRFYWAPQFAHVYKKTGNIVYLERLNKLMMDWCQHNKPNSGYQWLCAQETSIRLLNILLTNQIMNHEDNQKNNLTDFVELHLQRILPTLAYARAQDNNHATSEAAALFIGGMWLQIHGVNLKQRKIAVCALRKGRSSLEYLVRRLILADGTFSQYSVTYHRMLLDTLSLVVYFQDKLSDEKFSNIFYQKYRLVFEWLYSMMMSTNGLLPNLGSNDGTLLFKLDCCDYRDFRPSLQLASFLLDKKLLFNADGEYNKCLKILRLLSEDYVVAIESLSRQHSK